MGALARGNYRAGTEVILIRWRRLGAGLSCITHFGGGILQIDQQSIVALAAPGSRSVSTV